MWGAARRSVKRSAFSARRPGSRLRVEQGQQGGDFGLAQCPDMTRQTVGELGGFGAEARRIHGDARVGVMGEFLQQFGTHAPWARALTPTHAPAPAPPAGA